MHLLSCASICVFAGLCQHLCLYWVGSVFMYLFVGVRICVFTGLCQYLYIGQIVSLFVYLLG